MDILTFIVPEEYAGASLKGFLRSGQNVSGRLLIRAKQIPDGLRVNGVHATVRAVVAAGDKVEMRLPVKENLADGVDMPLAILYEDDWLLAVDKPHEMTMYPTPGHDTGLLNAVVAYYRKKGLSAAYHPVYRLDRDTTGVVLFAKDPYCAARLAGQPEKHYYAVCQGLTEPEGRVEAPIALEAGQRVQRSVTPEGQFAATRWRTLASGGGHSLLCMELETGRTHQIRVHMSHLGFPLAGDDLYGGSRAHIGRQALHCGEIWFSHPVTGAEIRVSAPLPEDMAKLLAGFGIANCTNLASETSVTK